MNNVKSEDIYPCIPLPDDVHVDSKQSKKMQLLSVMRVGKRYRPHQFVNLPIHDQTISKYLNQLNDEGLVERILDGPFVYWVRIK